MTQSLATDEHPLPLKFTPERVARLLSDARLGLSERLAADRAKIERHTLADWLRSNQHPAVQEFAADWAAAKASAAASLHVSVASAGPMPEHKDAHGNVVPERKGDWRASYSLLQAADPETYANTALGKLGLNAGPDAPTLTEAQIEHRVVKSMSHPTKRMLVLMAKAYAECNQDVRELLIRTVASFGMVTTGEEVTEPTELAEWTPPEWLAGKVAAFLDVLDQHKRIAIGGGPKTGKTRQFAAVAKCPVIHTDDFINGDWKGEAHLAAKACDGLAEFVLEGVRAVGVIRAGLQVDVLVWLPEPLVILTKGQETMRKGREKDLTNLRREMPGLKVVVL